MEPLVNNPAIVIIIVAAALSLIMTMVMIPIQQQQQQAQQFIQYAQALKKKSLSESSSSGPLSTRSVTKTNCDNNSPCFTTLCVNNEPCRNFQSNPPITTNINNSTDTNNIELAPLIHELMHGQ
jgi:type II secretory pathway pseudopilin PulG